MKVYVDDMFMKSLRVEDHVSDLKKTFDILRKYQMKPNSIWVSSRKFLGFTITKRRIEVNLEKIQAIVEIRSLQNIKEVLKHIGKRSSPKQVFGQVFG